MSPTTTTRGCCGVAGQVCASLHVAAAALAAAALLEAMRHPGNVSGVATDDVSAAWRFCFDANRSDDVP